jgi:hypothetical protein
VVYEERIYTIAPGKMPAILNRFRDHALRLFRKHGIHVVGFWMTDIGEHSLGELVYICSYTDLNARQAAWQAFRDDPEWQEARRASEVDGPLVLNVAVKVLTPTDFSALQ